MLIKEGTKSRQNCCFASTILTSEYNIFIGLVCIWIYEVQLQIAQNWVIGIFNLTYLHFYIVSFYLLQTEVSLFLIFHRIVTLRISTAQCAILIAQFNYKFSTLFQTIMKRIRNTKLNDSPTQSCQSAGSCDIAVDTIEAVIKLSKNSASFVYFSFLFI